MKKLYAAFTLFLLFFFLCVPIDAKETGSVRVIHTNEDGSKVDVTDDNHEDGDSDNKPHASDNDSTEEEEAEEVTTEKLSQEDEEGLLKSLRATFTGALEDFTYLIINQMMSGSVTIFEAEASTNEEDGTETVSYTIGTKIVKPFEPPYVVKSLVITGGLYIVCIIITYLLSEYMLIRYQSSDDEFDEVKPYTMSTVKTACNYTLAYPVIAFIYLFIVTGFRNLVVFYVTPHDVVIPVLYADSIPTQFLTGFSSWSSAIESAFGEYGIYTFCSMLFIAGAVTAGLLVFNHKDKAGIFNVVYWGAYGLFNLIDVINTCGVSAGVSTYIYNGNPIFITVGIIAGCSLSFIILWAIVKYAVHVNQTRGARGY